MYEIMTWQCQGRWSRSWRWSQRNQETNISPVFCFTCC